MLEIKEHKIREARLQQSEECFHNLMQSAYDSIIVVDGKGDIITWNNGAKNMFGYSEEEALGKPLMMLMPEKFRHVHKTKLDMVTSTGKANLMGKVLELQGLKKDGVEFPIELTLATWEVGKERFYSGIIRDISERKAAQEVIIESEEKFRTLYDSSSDAIMLFDEKGFFDCNNATLKIFGLSTKEDILKMHPTQVSPPYQPDGVDSQTAVNNKIAQVFSKGTNHFEWVHRKKSGEDFSADVLLTAFKFKGKPVLQATVRDITERKKMEALRLENERLVQANQVKAEFLAVMSHELRTPMNAILGFSTLLKQKIVGGLNEKQEKYVDNIITGGKHQINLIDMILDMTKLEAGKLELTTKKIFVPDAIKDVLILVKQQAEEHKVIIKTEIDPALDNIYADEQRFKIILFNLLDNAVKFSKPEGGEVIISSKKEGNMAKFSVFDTGIGISEEKVGSIFRSFQQVDTGLSRKYGGVGLGLAITKQLIELHGGTITVESKLGIGSTFTFILPVNL
ncbi:MAG: PAS domain S-box protein [Candidatus Methanoperedens sp.]|nr:PAS domain S-box protein [Candidatus Methanoperedens sp.]